MSWALFFFCNFSFFNWISSSLASKFFPFFSRTSFFSRKTAASSSRTLCQVVFFRRITGAGVGCPSGDGCSCWGWSDVEAVNKFALLLTLNEFLCPKITYANLRIPHSRNLGADFPHFLIPLQWKKSHAVPKLKKLLGKVQMFAIFTFSSSQTWVQPPWNTLDDDRIAHS